MKKVLFFASLLVAMISFASFTVHSPMAYPAAQPFNSQNIFDVTGVQYDNPCTGETIVLSGSIHSDVHGVVNGDKATYIYHANYQGVTAVGLTTGDSYRLISSLSNNYAYNYDVSGNTLTIRFTEAWQFITAGRDNNFYIKRNVAYVIDFVNGTSTVSRTQIESGCK